VRRSLYPSSLFLRILQQASNTASAVAASDPQDVTDCRDNMKLEKDPPGSGRTAGSGRAAMYELVEATDSKSRPLSVGLLTKVNSAGKDK